MPSSLRRPEDELRSDRNFTTIMCASPYPIRDRAFLKPTARRYSNLTFRRRRLRTWVLVWGLRFQNKSSSNTAAPFGWKAAKASVPLLRSRFRQSRSCPNRKLESLPVGIRIRSPLEEGTIRCGGHSQALQKKRRLATLTRGFYFGFALSGSRFAAATSPEGRGTDEASFAIDSFCLSSYRAGRVSARRFPRCDWPCLRSRRSRPETLSSFRMSRKGRCGFGKSRYPMWLQSPSIPSSSRLASGEASLRHRCLRLPATVVALRTGR